MVEHWENQRADSWVVLRAGCLVVCLASKRADKTAFLTAGLWFCEM